MAILLMLLPLLAAAQTVPVYNYFTTKKIQGGTPLMKQYGGSLEYFINLGLPDVDQAPAQYQKALSAVRDTVLQRTVLHPYIKGDRDHTKITALFRDSMLCIMEQFIESIDLENRDRGRFMYKWYVEYSGFLENTLEDHPLDGHHPFIQFYLQKTELIGNSFFTAENLVFDSQTGRLLTLSDLFDMTDEHFTIITDIMKDEFRKTHSEESDYDYMVDAEASFEISEEGLNFYIPTGKVNENQLDYVFVEKSRLIPYLRKDSLLHQFWSH